jgi:hypothetical protein
VLDIKPLMIPSVVGAVVLALGGGCARLRLHRKVTPFAAMPGAVKAAPRPLLSLPQYTTLCQGGLN